MALSPQRACSCLPDSDRDLERRRRVGRRPSSTEVMAGACSVRQTHTHREMGEPTTKGSEDEQRKYGGTTGLHPKQGKCLKKQWLPMNDS